MVRSALFFSGSLSRYGIFHGLLPFIALPQFVFFLYRGVCPVMVSLCECMESEENLKVHALLSISDAIRSGTAKCNLTLLSIDLVSSLLALAHEAN